MEARTWNTFMPEFLFYRGHTTAATAGLGVRSSALFSTGWRYILAISRQKQAMHAAEMVLFLGSRLVGAAQRPRKHRPQRRP
jgi:hypothetical protein